MNNTQNSSPLSALYGTKTEQNLRHAFDREAGTFARNSIYAAMAQRDGDVSAGRTLYEHAENDKRLAELWLGYLDELGDTLENLDEMASQKDSLAEDFYEEIAEIADEEGFSEIAEKMRLSGAVMGRHGQMLKDEKELLSHSRISDNADTVWGCTACGYQVTGNTPGEFCPLCGCPQQFFKVIG